MEPMRPDDPWKRLRELNDKIDRFMRETRSSMRALGATTFTGDLTVAEGGNVRAEGGTLIAIDPDTGSAAVMLNGRLRLYPTLEDAGRYGYISVPLGEDTPNQMWISPPRQDRERPDDTRLILRGASDGLTGYAWLYSGGGITLDAARTVLLSAGDNINLVASKVININPEQRLSVTSDRVEIVARARGTGLYGTPTTSATANLHLGDVAGEWQIARSTSSARYKTDIGDATIDPAEVLSLSGRSWVDIHELDNGPEGDLRRFVGFVAEDLDERPSLRQFVDYDDQGRPDAIQYDRLTVALLEVAKDQQSRLDTQADQIAALTARLDALEATD